METNTDEAAAEAQHILETCARLQQKSRILNDHLTVLKAGTYRTHCCEKHLRIASILCKDEETECQHLLSGAMLSERKLAKFIVRQAITRLNMTIESMDLQWDGCIAHSNPIYHALEAEFAVPLPEQMDCEMREAVATLGGARGLRTCADTVKAVLTSKGLEQQELEMMEYATWRIAKHRLRQAEQNLP
jgi:hypothetical protein